MPVSLITYDLSHKPEKDYEPVWKYIKQFDWARLSESSYAVDSTLSPQAIFNQLSSLIHDNDRMLVITLTRPYAGRHAKDVIDWLATHLGQP
jgi:hypothetical protein